MFIQISGRVNNKSKDRSLRNIIFNVQREILRGFKITLSDLLVTYRLYLNFDHKR